MARFVLLLSLFFFMALPDSPAQKQSRFNAGALLGLAASQVDGDDQRGYNKIGIVGGLRGITHLSRRLDLIMELLYSQRGSEPSPKGDEAGRPVSIRLNYAETPFLLAYKTGVDWNGAYRLQVQTGFSYARLLNINIEESEGIRPAERPSIASRAAFFSKNDISWKAGLAYFFSPKLSLGLRHTFSLNKLLDAGSLSEEGGSLRSYYFSLHLACHL